MSILNIDPVKVSKRQGLHSKTTVKNRIQNRMVRLNSNGLLTIKDIHTYCSGNIWKNSFKLKIVGIRDEKK